MASLDKLTIRGFKSIRALENFELKSLNLFIGANGAGEEPTIVDEARFFPGNITRWWELGDICPRSTSNSSCLASRP